VLVGASLLARAVACATLSVLPLPVLWPRGPKAAERVQPDRATNTRTEPRIMHGQGRCLQIRESGPPEGRPTRASWRAAALLLLRRDHHDHLAAFQARPGLDHDVLAQVGLDARGHAAAQLLVAHFTATEADVDL